MFTLTFLLYYSVLLLVLPPPPLLYTTEGPFILPAVKGFYCFTP